MPDEPIPGQTPPPTDMPRPESGFQQPPITEASPNSEAVSIKDYDKALAEAERIGLEVDKQFISEINSFEEWRNSLQWESGRGGPYHQSYDYKIQTTAPDGSQRTFVTNMNGEQIAEYDNDGNFLGEITVYNRETPSKLESIDKLEDPVAIGYGSADDPNYSSYGALSVFHEEGGASTKYGWIREGYLEGRHTGSLRRARYVAPGMEHLPSPMDKLKETTDMLKRGQVTHKVTDSPYNNTLKGGNWAPVSPPSLSSSQF